MSHDTRRAFGGNPDVRTHARIDAAAERMWFEHRSDGIGDVIRPDHLVTTQDVIARCGPEFCDRMLAVGRHHDSDDGTFWIDTEAEEIEQLIAIGRKAVRP